MLPQWGGIFQNCGGDLFGISSFSELPCNVGDGDSGEVQETYEGMVFWFLASLVG
jgi:hypothetical protein